MRNLALVKQDLDFYTTMIVNVNDPRERIRAWQRVTDLTDEHNTLLIIETLREERARRVQCDNCGDYSPRGYIFCDACGE